MAGEDRSASFRSSMVPLAAPAGFFALEVRGYLSFASAAEILRRADVLLRVEPGARVLVLDALQLDGFEPGVPARFIHWMGLRQDRVLGGFVVTLSPVLAATARAAALMLPAMVCASVATRQDAFRAGTSLLTGRPRTSSNVVARTASERVPVGERSSAERATGERKATG